jgi:uncharacterized membrane protein YukC
MSKRNIDNSRSFNKNEQQSFSINDSRSLNKNDSYLNSRYNDSTTSSENKPYFEELLKNKTLKYGLIGLVILVLLYLIYKIYYTPHTLTDNIKCPQDCSKYINGDIKINGKTCKVPVINGVKCPTNCIYEKEDNYVKYSDCNCDIDKPIKKS